MPTRQRNVDDAPLVLIVDDDEFIRAALANLLRSVGIECVGFASTKELLEADIPDRVGCMLLDVRLPGLSGIELQANLNNLGWTKPVIFMTGHGDIPMSVHAMKAGAVDFLTKPFRDQDMLDAVNTAIDIDRANRLSNAETAGLAALAATLTPREREVMQEIAKGSMNKHIAAKLGISEATVKLHRGNLMRKMKARSLAELVQKTERLKRP
ncbi:response regulator transcription factor [Phyllobacterium sp. P5_D12]